jgi:hypothetical protein
MISIMDFRTPEGKTDWSAYNAAQKVERQHEIASGKRCRTCFTFCYIGPRGVSGDCYECRSLKENASEVSHAKLIRCPNCRQTFNPADNDCYEVFQEGDEHSVACPSCGDSFAVRTHVSYSFTSPALLPKTEEEDIDAV